MPTRSAPRRQQPPDQVRAVVRFDQVQAGKDLSKAVEDRKPQLAALLGANLDDERGRMMLDRFVTVALHAATSRPDILSATRESLVEAIRDSAMLGLEPVGAAGDGAIVVYREQRDGTTVSIARFQPMYRGLLKLARRSDQLAHIDAQVVYVGDEIELDLGSSPKVRHFPVLDGTKRGETVGAYAVAELTNGRRYVEWMTTADIEIVRRSSRAGSSGPWVTFWGEMARKTVLRRLMKRLPLETMAEHAMRLESEAEDRAIVPVAPVEESDARRRLRSPFVSAISGEPDQGATGGEGSSTSNPPSEPEPAVSGRSSASAPENEVEGTSREVSEEPKGTRDADQVCGAPSDPALGPVETCVLEGGHTSADGNPSAHQSDQGSRWPNR